MIKNKNTYNTFIITDKLTNWFVIFFLVFFVSKPIIQYSLSIEDVKYELFDTTEKESSSENNLSPEYEDENKPHHSNNQTFQLYKINKALSFYIINNISTHNLDILLPPPK